MCLSLCSHLFMKDKNPNMISLLYSLNYHSLPQVHLYRTYLNFLEEIMTFCLSTAFVHAVLLALDSLLLLSSQPSLAYQTPTDTHNLDSEFLPISSVKNFLLTPGELGKNNECILTVSFSICTPILGAQAYFNGTSFQFQSMCFVWSGLYPWAWAGRTYDFGRANLCSPLPCPQTLFRFERMIKSGLLKLEEIHLWHCCLSYWRAGDFLFIELGLWWYEQEVAGNHPVESNFRAYPK